MFRKIASKGLMSMLAGAAALAGASLFAAAPAAAFDGYGPRGGFERGYDWRPPPPFQGYWGPRHWRRHHDGYGFRPPPPPPGYGWR